MQKYKMILAYDGTQYCGWQVQPHAASIQKTLQKAMETILQAPTSVTGAGRTDAGVHARGQVVHFLSSRCLHPCRFLYSLNSLLPSDIRVLSLEPVDESFHARYSAIAKIYHYHLDLAPTMDPFQKLYAYHHPFSLDIGMLQKAAKNFVGTHDFKSFAHHASTGVAARDSIRTLHRIDVVVQRQQMRIEFEGDGFLYKMVRNIVGTLLEVATGKRPLDTIPALLQQGDRCRAGATAPSHGLFLMQVVYP